MSSSEADEVCASCGKTAVDNIKLKLCTACKLVKYCSVECQKNHRKQHKTACRKRAAEIRDDNLFKQPEESYRGECPICCLTLPIDKSTSSLTSCCGNLICNGCHYANMMREMEQGLEERCLYCREPAPQSEEEAERMMMERVEVNDPDALCHTGKRYLARDYERAFEYLTKAAALGDFDAHYELSVMYRLGEGVEKDLKKETRHLEEAAIGGHPIARHSLGADEWNSGRYDRAAKHFIISAKQGYDDGLEMVKKGFTKGFVSKEEFEAALRGHQAAVDATKSKQREEAAEFYEWRNQQDGWPPKEVVGDK